MTYKKLFPIEFNHKKFMIFLDENKRRTFLEIDENGNYAYPSIDDFIALHNMFNQKNTHVFYAVRKFSFKEKVKKGAMGLLSVVVILSNLPRASASEFKIDAQDASFTITETDSIENLKYTNIFEDISDLDDYFGSKVSKDMVLEAINNNVNLNAKYKRIATKLLNAITAKYPDINLRIFYENIKTMNVIEYTEEEFRKIFPDAIGGGAQYNKFTNTITAINTVHIELLYHEMFHAWHHFYRNDNDIYLERQEKYNGFDEPMTNDGASHVSYTHSYNFSTQILNYLRTIVDFDLQDYNDLGIKNLISKLYAKYPNVDFDYIAEAAKTANHNLIYNGKPTYIDNCEDLLDELFDICLREASVEKGYKSFNNFAKIFSLAKNTELVFEYLEKYNAHLQSLGCQTLISPSEARAKYQKYKDANGLGYNDNEIFPIMYDIENDVITKISDNGNVILHDRCGYNVPFDFPSLVSSSMFSDYDNFGSSKYWQKLNKENGIISPHLHKSIPIYLNNQLLMNSKMSGLYLKIGKTKDHKIGFILLDNNSNVLYQSASELINESDSVLFSWYINPFSEYIEKLDLEDVLNEDYLKMVQTANNTFKNIETVDGNIIIIPDYTISIEQEIDQEKVKESYSLADCLITSTDGIVRINGTNISFNSILPLTNPIGLKDVLASFNVLDENTLEYYFTVDEIISMIKNYIVIHDYSDKIVAQNNR